MQYSPKCAVPYVSLVDGGTIELVTATGVEIVSSADLVQLFQAVWTEAQRVSHFRAGEMVDGIRRDAFREVGSAVRAGRTINEFAVQQFILERFSSSGLITDSGPIVAVNAHAADPHYEPTASTSSEIRSGDLLLIDMWAKLDAPDSVYYDITWTAFCGSTPSELIETVFHVVRTGRDRAVERVQNAVAEQREVRGYEVDDAARAYIASRGYADEFIHRTGHSIGVDVHGTGANMDNLESHDERRIITGTCFSIEPGIYLSDFGIRSEVNVYVSDREAIVTGEAQTELLRFGSGL
jgi:Xaa-Pro aminopeptidase